MRITVPIVLLMSWLLAACQSSTMNKRPDPAMLKTVQLFKLMDMDGDGRLSLGEALAYNTKNFTILDKDINGHLSLTEYQANIQSTREESAHQFRGMDQNLDKKLSLRESEFAINSFFTRYDKNGDNLLTVEEIQKSAKRKRSGRPSSRGTGRPSGTGRPGGTGRSRW